MRRSIVTEERTPSLRTLLELRALSLSDFAPLFSAVQLGEALPHLLLIRILASSGAYSAPRVFFHHHNSSRSFPAAGVASEDILSPLEGRSMQDPASELLRIPLLSRWANKGKKRTGAATTPRPLLSPFLPSSTYTYASYPVIIGHDSCVTAAKVVLPVALGIRYCLPLALSRAYSMAERPRTSSGAAPRPDLSPNYLGISKTVTLKWSFSSMVVCG